MLSQLKMQKAELHVKRTESRRMNFIFEASCIVLNTLLICF